VACELWLLCVVFWVCGVVEVWLLFVLFDVLLDVDFLLCLLCWWLWFGFEDFVDEFVDELVVGVVMMIGFMNGVGGLVSLCSRVLFGVIVVWCGMMLVWWVSVWMFLCWLGVIRVIIRFVVLV